MTSRNDQMFDDCKPRALRPPPNSEFTHLKPLDSMGFFFGLFRVFSGCPVDPCAIMQFLWDRYRPLRSSLAADRAPASHKSLITFMLA